MAKLKPRTLGRPALLRPAAEREAEKAAAYESMLSRFLDWFQKIPGAEWETGSTDGLLMYCRYHANATHPEWGKAFCAVRIDDPPEKFQEAIRGYQTPPLEWDHWTYLDLLPSSSHDSVIVRFHEKCKLQPEERRFIETAYRRCLADIFARMRK